MKSEDITFWETVVALVLMALVVVIIVLSLGALDVAADESAYPVPAETSEPYPAPDATGTPTEIAAPATVATEGADHGVTLHGETEVPPTATVTATTRHSHRHTSPTATPTATLRPVKLIVAVLRSL
jgi:hypothetical protein